MSTKTTNYKLTKPELTDAANITDMNTNWDTIDTELKQRAVLGSDGVISKSQLPNLDYVPNTEKGNGNGVATLDSTGQIPANQLGNIFSKLTGGASTILTDNLPWGNRVLISNASKKVAESDITSTELGYLNGVTSNVQTQLGKKVAKSGDELTGALDFKNSSEFRAISKTRLINDTTYYVNWGCGQLGGEGIIAMELHLPSTTGGNSTVLGRLEIGSRGVSFLDANNKRTYLYARGLTAASVES